MPRFEDASPLLSARIAQGGVADAFGDNVIDADVDGTGASTLAGAAIAELQYGVRNPIFSDPPPDIAAPIENYNNQLPYWFFFVSAGSAISAKWVSESHLRYTITGDGSASDAAYIEQLVPAVTTITQDMTMIPLVSVYGPTALIGTAGSAIVKAYAQFVQSDGTTTTGTAGTASSTLTAIDAATGDQVRLRPVPNATGAVPTDAAYLRIRVAVERDVAAVTAAGSVDITSVRLQTASTYALVTDILEPSTYGPLLVQQASGFAYMRPATDAAGVATGSIAIYAGTGKVVQLGYASDVYGWVSFEAAASGGPSIYIGDGAAAADTRIYRNATMGAGALAIGNYLLIPEQSAPATPPSGFGLLYVSTAGRLRFINDAGTDTAITP